MIKQRIIIVTFLFFQLNFFGQNQSADSLKLALKNAKHDTTRCNILSELTEVASDEEWPGFNEQLKKIAEKNIANNAAPKNAYLKHLATAFNNLGFSYNYQSNISKALECLNMSLNIYEEIGDKFGIANSMNNIGFIYQNQGDVSKALDYHLKSLKIREAMGSKSGIAESLNNIGFVYQKQNDIPKALECWFKSLKINEEISDKKGVALLFNNIGAIYNTQNKLPMALMFWQKSLKIKQEIGDKSGIAASFNNLGVISHKLGENIQSLDYHSKSLKISGDIEDKEGVVYSLNNIADVYFSLGEIPKALRFANLGMQNAKELGYPVNIKSSARVLKSIFQKQNKYKEAFEMYELEIKMGDSINNQETQKAAVKKQLQYAYEKKELETKAEQDKKDAVAKEELKQKENERNYFIVGFGLVAVLALFILRSYKHKQKANATILAQKHLVDEKQKEILDSIRYAKRIQTALLPSEKYIDKSLQKLNKV